MSNKSKRRSKEDDRPSTSLTRRSVVLDYLIQESRKRVQKDSSLPPLPPIVEPMSNLSLDDKPTDIKLLRLPNIKELNVQLSMASQELNEFYTKWSEVKPRKLEDEESEKEEKSSEDEEDVNNCNLEPLRKPTKNKTLNPNQMLSLRTMPKKSTSPGRHATTLQNIDAAPLLDYYADHEEEVEHLELKLLFGKELAFPALFYFYGLFDFQKIQGHSGPLRLSHYIHFFYIGLGGKNRHKYHAAEARKSGVKSAKVDKINEIWNNGGSYMSVKIGPVSHNFAAAMEGALIKLIKCVNGDQLKNAHIPKTKPKEWTDEDMMKFGIIGLKKLLSKVGDKEASQIFKKKRK